VVKVGILGKMRKISSLATKRNAAKRAQAKAELPPNPMMVTWEVEKRPTDEWLAENGADCPDLPPDEHMIVGINVYLHMGFPQVGVLPANWKRGRVLLCTWEEQPYHRLEAECRADAGLPPIPLKDTVPFVRPGAVDIVKPLQDAIDKFHDPTQDRCSTCGATAADHTDGHPCTTFAGAPDAA